MIVRLFDRVPSTNDLAGQNGARTRFLILDDGRLGADARRSLEAAGAVEVAASELRAYLPKSFKDLYSRFIAELNIANAAFDWWAMNFTGKNPIATPLCYQVFYALAIAHFAARGEADRLVVVLRDADLAAQLARQFQSHATIRVLGRVGRRWRDKIRAVLPFGIIATAVRVAALKVAARLWRISGREIPPEPVVLFSLFNHQSFSVSGFRDAYFGSLPERLAVDHSVLLIGQTMQNGFATLRSLRDTKLPYAVQPMESILDWRDWLWALVRSLSRFQSPPAFDLSARVAGLDPSVLVRRAVRANVKSGRYFLDLCFYRSILALDRRARLARLIYPFENRSWEKMLLAGFRGVAKDGVAIGYQHAALTEKHLNFVFEAEELDVVPLPNRVVTMGAESKDFMTRFGGFPESKLAVGCVLRWTADSKLPVKPKPPRIRRILVALATDYGEYRGVLSFLEGCLNAESPYEIRIRAHPVFPLAYALNAWGPYGFPFSEDTNSSSTSLEWADVLMYASSTLGLEAVASGTPAVYVEWGDIMNVDPLRGLKSLKWTVNRPADLQAVFGDIESLAGDDYRVMQTTARRFAERYAIPVSKSGVAPFFPDDSDRGSNNC